MRTIESDRGKVVGRINRRVAIAGAVLLLCALLGLVAVHRFVAAEGEREMQQWQVRLGIVAASRAQAVREWKDRQFAALSGLADNLSLQLYLTEAVNILCMAVWTLQPSIMMQLQHTLMEIAIILLK